MYINRQYIKTDNVQILVMYVPYKTLQLYCLLNINPAAMTPQTASSVTRHRNLQYMHANDASCICYNIFQNTI